MTTQSHNVLKVEAFQQMQLYLIGWSIERRTLYCKLQSHNEGSMYRSKIRSKQRAIDIYAMLYKLMSKLHTKNPWGKEVNKN